MMDIDFVVAVTTVQQDYLNESYVLEFAGRQFTVALSDMHPASEKQMAAFADANAIDESSEAGEIKFFAFNLGQVSDYSAGKIVSHNIEVKADHPAEQANFIMGACFVVNGKVTSGYRNVEVYKGIYGNDQDLNGFAKEAMSHRM